MKENNKKAWERISMVMDASGFNSVTAFAHHIGLKRGENLFQIKRGNNGISLQLARKINIAFPQFGVSWLLSGEGVSPSELSKTTSHEFIMPYYSELPEIHIEPTLFLKLPHFLKRDATFAVQNPDDGLSSRYEKGCVLLLKNPELIIYGKPYLVLIGSTALLRIVKRGSVEGSLLLLSDDDKKYDSLEVPGDNVKSLHEVCGAIVGCSAMP